MGAPVPDIVSRTWLRAVVTWLSVGNPCLQCVGKEENLYAEIDLVPEHKLPNPT